MNEYEIAFVSRMTYIPEIEWDALASRFGNPLLGWGYLALLEESGSICPATGWNPVHLTVRRSGKLVAAAPLYIRTDSWGDYVFDFEFAACADRIKAPYYPKLVGTIPATPAPVWRVLTEVDDSGLESLCIQAAREAARKAGLAGTHFLWVDPGFLPVLAKADEGSCEWRHQYFHWTNSGYRDIADCLDSWSKNMRRNVSRERDSVRKSGMETCIISPHDCSPRYLELMADCYEDTNAKFGPYAAKFLTRDFFIRLPDFMPSGWALSAAFSASRAEPVALAFLLEAERTLYGRFWGRTHQDSKNGDETVSGLHFEVCFYTPMEYVIAKGLEGFDPGMGSEHKARRGFRAELCSSFHCLFDRRMQKIFASSMSEINAAELEMITELNRDL
ncbi:MAG: peptidogalycan biosysnthesis protein, partial [Rectinemataceae bacterium]|nr:peptidogalycan biosysnthesis protein [Rectinemataceae bacterium]